MILNVIFPWKEKDVSKIIYDFGKHTDEVHGIEYSKESIM